MAISYLKSKKKPLLFDFNASRSFCSNRISPSIPSFLQKITCGFKPQAPSPLFSGTSFTFTRFHLVSAASLVGVLQGGTRRFYYSNRNLCRRSQSSLRAKFSETAAKSLATTFSRASGKWTAHGVLATVVFGSCLLFIIFGGRIERVPYSNRFHYTLSAKLEKKCGQYKWLKVFQNADDDWAKILPPSDPRAIRVESIARKLLQALDKGLMLQHQHKIVAGTLESSRLISEGFKVNADSASQEMIQQRQNNRTRKITWKPATKHLDGKVWEVYVTTTLGCHLDGKIVIRDWWIDELKSDAELATVIGHEIGHSVARHFAERFMTLFSLVTSAMLLLFNISPLRAGGYPEGQGAGGLVAVIEFFIHRRREAEADYIGLMLMASAGYDPQVAPDVYEKRINHGFSEKHLLATHFSGKRRADLLKKPKAMKQAIQVFEEVKAGYGVRSFV